jgi:FMN reductase
MNPPQRNQHHQHSLTRPNALASAQAPADRPALQLVAVNGGTGDPSSTGMLAAQIADRVVAIAGQRGATVLVRTVSLRALANEITTATVSGLLGPQLTDVVHALRDADGIIASTPVYKAAASGLFSSFFQILDNDLLIGKPVILAATAGSERHALVIDDQVRPMFAYLRTLTAPTSVFAAASDWNSAGLGTRINRAAIELALLMESGFARHIKDESWDHYQHEYGSAGGSELGIDLDTDLMRLATGGSASQG